MDRGLGMCHWGWNWDDGRHLGVIVVNDLIDSQRLCVILLAILGDL